MDDYKLLKKIREGPNNVRPLQLKRLMEGFGFVVRKKSKHFVHYHHPDFFLSERAVVSEHREKGQESNVLQCYVKSCLKAIDELLLKRGDINEK